MPQTGKSDISYDSADGKHRVAGYIYTPEAPARAVVQVSHGMCEHIGRYEEFAGFLCGQGIAFAGNDHLGHGETAASEEGLGFFAERDGCGHVLRDLYTMNQFIAKSFPNVPVFLLGHSMGSFFARWYATEYPDSINALIISGTGGPSPFCTLGLALTGLLSVLRGPRYRSVFVDNMAFGAYLKRIESPKTRYDWLSRDEAVVEKYNRDPKCGFRFTVNGFHEEFRALKTVSRADWATKIPAEMPVQVISGDADPVGDYGRGVQTVYERLKRAGIKDLHGKLYPGMRHEVLNEVGREEVYKDVLEFIDRYS